LNEQDFLLLITIYQEQNMTRAAEKLHISQPTLTYRLKQIEQRLEGTKIIYTNRKQLMFTPEGEYLVQFAKKSLTDLYELKLTLQNFRGLNYGSLKIGASNNFSIYKLPPIVKSFLNYYPNIQLDIRSGWSAEILQMLEKKQIDIGFITGDYNWAGEKTLVNHDPLTIINNSYIDVEKLPSMPKINYKPKKLYRASLELKNTFTQLENNWWAERFEKEPNIVTEVDKVETCKKMVEQDLGYSIIPSSCITERDRFYTKNLISLGGVPLNRKTHMFYNKNLLKRLPTKSFISHVKNLFTNSL